MAVPPESLQIRVSVTATADFYRQLGRRIAALRRSVGLSQERLGERARVGASYVAHIEIGSRKPTIDVLLRIAGAVDAPLWQLLTDDRFTTDEKAWDAAARELAESVHGLAQPDLQALTYLATRLKTAESPAKLVPMRAGPPSSTSAATRAAEPRGPNWRSTSRRRRTKRSR
jgi:transcriptional regulator with XRE-family HTH domain